MRKLCQCVIAAFLCCLAVFLFTASFFAASSVSVAWGALDYWLAWFAFVGFLGGCASSIAGVIAMSFFLDGLCD